MPRSSVLALAPVAGVTVASAFDKPIARWWPGLVGLALLAPVFPAFAHAFLERASPPVGSEIAASPPVIAITFTEGVEPLFSTIEVHGPNGAAVPAGMPYIAPGNNRILSIQLPKLPSGLYTVIWHVTSVDTHKTEGNYQFTVSH